MTTHPTLAKAWLAGLITAGLAVSVPTWAECSTSRLFRSYSETSASYVITPGVPSGGPTVTVTTAVTGFFWALGQGDPSLGSGDDNGSYSALDVGLEGWLYVYPGYSATISGDWAGNSGTDGCIDNAPAPQCMGLLLADQVSGAGYFAYLTQLADTNQDFLLERPGIDFVLATVPKPSITGSQSLSPIEVHVHLTAPSPLQPGLYADSACLAPTPIGYKIYEMQVPRGGAAPVDRSIGNGWVIADRGEEPDGSPIPLTAPATIALHCPIQSDVYLVTSLFFDSGFETPYVSSNSTRIECGSCEINADGDSSCAAIAGGSDCDDQNPTVFPGAAQLCDGLNNDCADPQWPALPADEVDADQDSYSICEGDCDDLQAAVSPGALELCDGIDNDCNGLLDEDLDGEDSDLDSVPNLCDNCRLDRNPSQSDLDGDAEGDRCDLDDGLSYLMFPAADRLEWQVEQSLFIWNLYRSDLLLLQTAGLYTQLPGSNPLAAQECGTTQPFTEQLDEIPPGSVAFYLVTGVGVAGETDLGADSQGATRTNAIACP